MQQFVLDVAANTGHVLNQTYVNATKDIMVQPIAEVRKHYKYILEYGISKF